MIDAQILQALQTAVTVAVTASVSPELPVKYVTAKSFSIPNDQKYLECVFIPNNINGQFWGKERTYRGVLRLLLHWPINGGGVYSPINLLAGIASYFEKGTQFDDVRISDNPDFGGIIENGQELIFVVTIPYRDFQP